MANVIRFTELTPETYSNQSRDFQMICALFDNFLNMCKYEIDGMQYLNCPMLCPDEYLDNLSKKLGFEHDSIIYNDDLRRILNSFRKLVQYKGSFRGIKESIQLFMNIRHIYFEYEIDVQNEIGKIYINVYDQVVENTDMLTDILKYILPCGYLFEYRFLVSESVSDDYSSAENVSAVLINSPNNSLRVSGESPVNNDYTNLVDVTEKYEGNNEDLINNFNTMQVVSKAAIAEAKALLKEGQKHEAKSVNYVYQNGSLTILDAEYQVDDGQLTIL